MARTLAGRRAKLEGEIAAILAAVDRAGMPGIMAEAIGDLVDYERRRKAPGSTFLADLAERAGRNADDRWADPRERADWRRVQALATARLDGARRAEAT
jgi:hypothetical protein